MRRGALALLAGGAIAAPRRAGDPGPAAGPLGIHGNKIDHSPAHAAGRHRNQLTKRSDNTLIIPTDKPLADSTNLHDFEASLPDGVNGVMVCLDRDKRVTHVAVQHPSGMFDG